MILGLEEKEVSLCEKTKKEGIYEVGGQGCVLEDDGWNGPHMH
jgi:hypothetical protein